MLKSAFFTVICFCLLCTGIVLAQPSPGRHESNLDAALHLCGDQDFSVRHLFPSATGDPALLVKRPSGFYAEATYQLFPGFHTGGRLTHYELPDDPAGRYTQTVDGASPLVTSVSAGQTQFGFVGYLATAWAQPTRRASWLHTRVSIGGILDATGFRVTTFAQGGGVASQNASLGRIHDHQFFLNLDLGFRNPFVHTDDLFYIRCSIIRSIPVFSGDTPGLVVSPGDPTHFALGVGISL